MKQELMRWQLHQMGKSFASRSRLITMQTPHYSNFTGWMLFLTPNQQCQCTEDRSQQA